MALAGLPEALAQQMREAKPRKLVEKELEKRRRQEEEEDRLFGNGKGLVEEGALRPLQASELLLSARLSDCDLLLRAVKAYATVLDKSGRELQRISHVVRADRGFKRSLESGDPPLAQAGLGALEAFTGLGTALAALSTALIGTTYGGLQEIRSSIRLSGGDSLADIALAEQEEDQCTQALRYVSEHKAKLDAELATQTADHENYEQGGLSSWFRKPSNTKLQKTLQQQRTLVEELAAHNDRAAAARLDTKRHCDKFRHMIRDLDVKCKSQMQGVLDQCSVAWKESVQSVEGAAVRLRSGTSAAAAAAAAAAPVPADLAGAVLRSVPAAGAAASGAGEAGAGARGTTAAAGAEELNDVQVCFPDSGEEGESHGDAAAAGALAPAAAPQAAVAQAQAAAPSTAAEAASAPQQSVPRRQRGRQPSTSPQRSAGSAASTGSGVPAAVPGPTLEELAGEAAAAATDGPGGVAAGAGVELATPSLPLPPAGIGGSRLVPCQDKENRFTVTFDKSVAKLGFRVLWEKEWPSVEEVMPNEAGQRLGVCSGDILREINGTITFGRGRAELIELLKARPLELVLDTNRRAQSSSRGESPEPAK